MITYPQLAHLTDEEIGRTEEDVKINVIVPWLDLLGHNRLNYEHAKNDILVKISNYHPIVVETKKLGTTLEGYIPQVQKYALERRAYIAILTNGDDFLLFSPLWRKRRTFKETLVFSFKRSDLKSKPLINSLQQMMSIDAINKNTALESLEEREKFIEHLQESIKEELTTMKNQKNNLIQKIDEHKRILTLCYTDVL